jgi:endonuclease/exonuclease/phosphatase family metal-dependent hydrolase
MFRRSFVPAVAAIVWMASIAAAQQNPTIKIMTQNMDAGTDLGYALYGLQQPDPRPYIDLTLAEIETSYIPERAGKLATEIASDQPYLVSLQEATLWRTGATTDTATNVLYDQLDLLMTALAADGAHYRVVAVNTLTDIVAPTTSAGPGALRFTDRDVLLARSDLSPSQFQVSDVQTNIYKVSLSFGPYTVKRGYITALARVNNRLMRVAATHLENQYAEIPGSAMIQQLQAAELMAFLRNSPMPVILAGDFNADAIQGVNGPGPDNTNLVSYIEAGGYADSWAVANGVSTGATWPLFLEDQTSGFFFKPSTPWERIDLIFSRGGVKVLTTQSSLQIGAGLTYPDSASDHTGVMTTFQLQQ